MWTLKIEACAESQKEAAWQAIGVIEMALRGIPASEFSKSSTKGSAVGNWEEHPASTVAEPAETSPGAASIDKP